MAYTAYTVCTFLKKLKRKKMNEVQKRLFLSTLNQQSTSITKATKKVSELLKQLSSIVEDLKEINEAGLVFSDLLDAEEIRPELPPTTFDIKMEKKEENARSTTEA